MNRPGILVDKVGLRIGIRLDPEFSSKTDIIK